MWSETFRQIFAIPLHYDDQVVHLRCSSRVGGDTRYEAAENLPARDPITDADLRPIRILETPLAPRRTEVGAFGLARSAASGRSLQIPDTRVCASARVLPPLLVSPRSPRSTHPATSFLLRCGCARALPRGTRTHARKTSLPRNYFHMIPIAGQIKTALSASHADSG